MPGILSMFKRPPGDAVKQTGHILVVDDESNIRMMIRLALQHVGHTVETASDGEEGLVRFGSGEGWDLVLLDHRMPGLSGLEVLREIHRRDPRMRVVMITAFGTIDLAVEAMRAGATDFLRKPFTAEVLRGAVNAAMLGVDREPAGAMAPEDEPASPLTFGLTGINGFHIESHPGAGLSTEGTIVNAFTVYSPEGESREYGVVLPPYVVELVMAYADREEMPGGSRFWQALCEEVLANQLWQHGEFPPDSTITVEDVTTGLRRWVDTVLAAATTN